MKALEEGSKSRLLRVLKLKQGDRQRLFYILKELSNVESLKTVLRAQCLRDDLRVFDIEVTYTVIPNAGIMEEATFKLVPDPESVGVDPLGTARLIDRILNGRNP